jgi:hypothetical protein
MRPSLRRALACGVAVLAIVQWAHAYATAAPGSLVADVMVPDEYPSYVAPSVAFDGQHLYYAEYGGSTLFRIDVPPAGSAGTGTGQTRTPIQGAQSGIMTLTYDRGRGAFWAIGGDGLSMYLLTRGGVATLVFTIDPSTDRPGFVPGPFPTETKVAYDASDDTLWYSPDGNARIFHYRTTADAAGSAAMVESNPYIDVDAAPNDMVAECGYSQSSGVAVGGAHLFISVAGCNYYFEYTKTGQKIAAYAYDTNAGTSAQDLECDDQSYGVPVLWLRDGYDGHMRAFEQPRAGACAFGGGAAPASTPSPTVAPTPTPTIAPTSTPQPLLPIPTMPPLPTIRIGFG